MTPAQNVVPDGNNKEPEGLRVSNVLQSFSPVFLSNYTRLPIFISCNHTVNVTEVV